MIAEWIAGVDEVGRGPLAGPVVAAAVVLDPARPIDGLRDSKQLTPRRREALALEIRTAAVCWAIGRAEVEEIDRLNILQATFLAMRRAIGALPRLPARALVDGNQRPDLGCAVEAIVGGDRTIPSISAASIIAKVERDNEMDRLDAEYPGYGLGVHKGYPTAQHLEALRRLGPSAIHRRSFGPVRRLLTGPAGGSAVG